MKIAEHKPARREFVLTVTEDELRVITEALNNSGTIKSGGASDFGVWDVLSDFMDDNDISKSTES